MASLYEAPEYPPAPILRPVPEEWNQRVMMVDPDVVYPVEREEAEHKRRGLGAWTEYLFLRLAQLSLGWLPLGVLGFVLTPILWLVMFVDKRHTRSADDFIRSALPQLDGRQRRKMTLDAWRHFISVVLRAPRVSNLTGETMGKHFEVRVSNEAREVIESGVGFALATGHIGNWEATGLACQAMKISPMYGIGRVMKNEPLSRHLQRTREKTGGIMLPRAGAMKGAPKVIRAGGCVTMLLDHRSRKKPVWAPFFGRPAACDRSAGVLLRRLGAPIVFAACYHQRHAKQPYRFELGAVLHPKDLAGNPPEQIAARVNHELERLILAEPSQYFWLHDRFKDAPKTFAELEERQA